MSLLRDGSDDLLDFFLHVVSLLYFFVLKIFKLYTHRKKQAENIRLYAFVGDFFRKIFVCSTSYNFDCECLSNMSIVSCGTKIIYIVTKVKWYTYNTYDGYMPNELKINKIKWDFYFIINIYYKINKKKTTNIKLWLLNFYCHCLLISFIDTAIIIMNI